MYIEYYFISKRAYVTFVNIKHHFINCVLSKTPLLLLDAITRV